MSRHSAPELSVDRLLQPVSRQQMDSFSCSGTAGPARQFTGGTGSPMINLCQPKMPFAAGLGGSRPGSAPPYGHILLPWRCLEDQEGLTASWRSGL
jgi:hypothetical protein